MVNSSQIMLGKKIKVKKNKLLKSLFWSWLVFNLFVFNKDSWDYLKVVFQNIYNLIKFWEVSIAGDTGDMMQEEGIKE